MTDKRRHADEPGDPRVSQIYRQLAGESAPQHLDHAVLNAARAAARATGRGPAIWLRPAAWVTTIGLCLAIVLEVVHVPQEEAEFESALEDRQVEASRPPAAELPATPPAVTSDAATPLPTRGEIEASKRLDKAERSMPAMSAGRTAAMPGAEEPVVSPAAADEIVRDAPDSPVSGGNATRERIQAVEALSAQGAALLEAVPAGVSPDLAAQPYCEESRTTDAESWHACILELEQQGLYEAARIERERLAEAFPPPETP